MAKYYSYNVTMEGARFKGAKFADGSPWTYSCRAPDAETAKLTAARWFQKHRAPFFGKPRRLVFLMSRMKAWRVER